MKRGVFEEIVGGSCVGKASLPHEIGALLDLCLIFVFCSLPFAQRLNLNTYGLPLVTVLKFSSGDLDRSSRSRDGCLWFLFWGFDVLASPNHRIPTFMTDLLMSLNSFYFSPFFFKNFSTLDHKDITGV